MTVRICNQIESNRLENEGDESEKASSAVRGLKMAANKVRTTYFIRVTWIFDGMIANFKDENDEKLIV